MLADPELRGAVRETRGTFPSAKCLQGLTPGLALLLLLLALWEVMRQPGGRSHPTNPSPLSSCLPCCVLCLITRGWVMAGTGPWSQLPQCPAWAAGASQAISPNTEGRAVIPGTTTLGVVRCALNFVL